MNLRAYHFNNFYLSPIQHGIQTAHCQTAMAEKYRSTDGVTSDLYWKWCETPVTICLNGGNYQGLLDAATAIVECQQNYGDPASAFPFGVFHEDKESLNEMLTNVGVILPEYIWGLYKSIKRDLPAFAKRFNLDASEFSHPNIVDMWEAHNNQAMDFASKAIVNHEKGFGVTLEMRDVMLADFIKDFHLI